MTESKDAWRFEFLGGMRVVRGSMVIDQFRTQKTASLLALLALQAGKPQPRERLVERFWPDADPEAGRHSLSQTLSWIRKALSSDGETLLIADRTNVRLERSRFVTDVAEFESAAAAARTEGRGAERDQRLREALDAYGGELLPALFDDWILAERDRLAEVFLTVLADLGGLAESRGDIPQAIELSRRAIAVDPLREDAHRDLMRRLALAGQTRAALRHYRELGEMLRRELDAAPDDESRELARSIEAGAMRVRTRVPDEAPPAAVRPTGIPVSFTTFFGRESELRALDERLSDPSVRLVTITGVGGTGKSRLASIFAERSRDAGMPVVFVPLADLTDAAHVPGAVLSAAGGERTSARPILDDAVEAIRTAAGDRRLLLVLDNLEQLIPAASSIVRELLERLPVMAILATSRSPLRIAGEQEAPLTPLPVPDPTASLEELETGDCIRMFVDRARLVRPAFRLDAASAAAVAQLCARLEGIPLAIELAAARTHALSIGQLLELLARPLDLLESRSSDIPERHRTLRNAIAWSERLLPPDLRQVFAALSVFRGGWTLGAAEAVTGRESSFDDLAELRAASLVVAEDAGDHVRYRMLDTIRAYAAEQLDAETLAWLRSRHADFYGLEVRGSDRHLWGERQTEWIGRIALDVENLRGALAWTIDEGGDRETGLEIAASLEWFWNTRGDWREGRAWLERALGRSRGPAGPRARATLALANLAERQGDFVEAREAYERALELIRPLDEPAMLARTLHNLAIVLRDVGDYDRAMVLESEALEHFRLVRDARGIAVCLNSLGVNAAERGDYATAVRWFAETLDLCRALGSERGVAYALHNQGEAATRTGDLATAEALLGEGLELAERVGDRGLRASLLTVMASAAFDGCDVGRAADLAADALDAAVELGDKRCIASVLEVAGCLAARRGERDTAVALAVAGAALRESIGHAASAGERDFVERHISASESQLDARDSERARRLGASLPLDRALILARSAIDSTDPTD